MSEQVKKTFQVNVEVTQTHQYQIEANSPEEAEGIAEQWLEDGEAGEVIDKEVFDIDTFEADQEETN